MIINKSCAFQLPFTRQKQKKIRGEKNRATITQVLLIFPEHCTAEGPKSPSGVNIHATTFFELQKKRLSDTQSSFEIVTTVVTGEPGNNLF
jgi:hypothetical protein